jgi:prefoldin alpha subunit
MSDEQELNRLAMQARLIEREGQIMQGQIEMMQTSASDLNATIESLSNLAKAKDVGLLPIGSGAYITCREVDTGAVLITIGGGLIAKKSAKDAIEILEKRRDTVSRSLEEAQKNFITLNQRIQEINSKASVLAARMENVRPSQE